MAWTTIECDAGVLRINREDILPNAPEQLMPSQVDYYLNGSRISADEGERLLEGS